jgi:hypothetical protein
LDVTEDTVQRVRENVVRSPRKSVSRASRELQVPEPTVRKILRNRLQLIQKLKPNGPPKRLAFCEEVLGMMERDEGLSKRIIFSDESTFHLSGKVNRHSVRIWGSEKPVSVVQMERDSPRVNVFCAVSRRRVFGPFFFAEKSVTG